MVLNPVGNIEVTAEAGLCGAEITYPDFIENKCASFIQTAGIGPDSIFPIGSTTETWKVTGMNGEETEITFDVTVIPTSDLPTVDVIADTVVNEDTEASITLSGISYGADCDSQEVSVVAESTNPMLVTDLVVSYTSPDSSGVFDLILVPDAYGIDTITVTVTDSEGASVSETFVLTVNPVNDAPFIETPLQDIMLKSSNETEISVSAVFDDVDDDELVCDIKLADSDVLPEWATIENEVLTIYSTLADTGSFMFVANATDTSMATATDTFMLVVEGTQTAIDAIDGGMFEINMYPNPSKGKVFLKINSSVIADLEVLVRSITGSEVFRKKYKAGDQIQIDLSDQVSGLYLVALKQEDNVVIKKLILDRK